MTSTVPLEAAQAAQLITALRHDEALDEAASVLGIELTGVWAAARTDVRLTIALAGRDPDSPMERARIARAEYLRLLALGVPRARAELILGEGDPGSWRTDPVYAQACDAVAAAAAPYGYVRQLRLTPQRVARFLHTLRREGREGSVKAAAAAVGIAPSAPPPRPGVRSGHGPGARRGRSPRTPRRGEVRTVGETGLSPGDAPASGRCAAVVGGLSP